MEPTTPLPPRRRPARPNPLSSPWLTGALGVLLIGLIAATLAVSGLLPLGGAASPTPGGTATPGPTGTPGPTPSPSFGRPTPTPLPTFTSHVVRVNESLTSIAKQYGTTPRSIAWWNRGTYPSLDPESPDYDPNDIRPGWILVLLPNTVVDDANPPTPSPGPPSPTPGTSTAPSSGPTSSPVPGGAAVVVSAGPRGTKQVALTLDMGGRLDPALDIVRWLIDHDVHATLFPTGKTGSTTDVGKAVLQLAATRSDLFDIGDHSWDHPDFTGLSAAQMADQLTRTEAAIAPLAGQTTKPWFRPPYGAWDAKVRAGVGAAGWGYIVMWDVDTIDWKPTSDGGPTADDIVAKVLSRAQGGSIVLMHLGGYHTLEALPRIVAGLADKGLTPVTLGEMLGR
jgi:peptidoglycan/xylan/chitin deacetylase (PgdA/CDA1 family)